MFLWCRIFCKTNLYACSLKIFSMYDFKHVFDCRDRSDSSHKAKWAVTSEEHSGSVSSPSRGASPPPRKKSSSPKASHKISVLSSPPNRCAQYAKFLFLLQSFLLVFCKKRQSSFLKPKPYVKIKLQSFSNSAALLHRHGTGVHPRLVIAPHPPTRVPLPSGILHLHVGDALPPRPTTGA